MKFLRTLGPSIRAAFAHKMRATLALASVAAGVAAVLVTNGIGAGVERQILRETENMGSNLLVVRPAQVANTAARKGIRGFVTTLKVEDYRAIAALEPVREAAPGFDTALTVKAGGNAMKATVLGTTGAYLEICRFRLREGRFLDDGDDRAARRVVVLGARVNEILFEGADPLGQEIRIRGVPFEVIGVLEAKGVLADGSNQDSQALIPIRTALRRVFNARWLNPVFVSVRDARSMDRASTEIASLLRERHRLDANGKPDDFSIQNKEGVLGAQKKLAESLRVLTAGLAAVSLVVGGTGVLALMLMSVKERTGEIGLRMAVGARPGNILAQFLLEAVLLSLTGWLAGLALGAAGAAVIAGATAWTVALTEQAILASLAMAAVTGLGFGWYPARKASLMPPIQALQLE